MLNEIDFIHLLNAYKDSLLFLSVRSVDGRSHYNTAVPRECQGNRARCREWCTDFPQQAHGHGEIHAGHRFPTAGAVWLSHPCVVCLHLYWLGILCAIFLHGEGPHLSIPQCEGLSLQ